MIAGPSVSLRVATTAPSAVVARTGATTTGFGARADVDLIDAPVLPRGRVQPGDVWLELDGQRHGESVLIEWSVAAEDAGVAEWSVTAAAESLGVHGPLGIEGAGPAMAGRAIDLGVTIGTADYTLITGAQVVDSARGLAVGARVLEVSGLGLIGHYDRLSATLQLPAEHGLTAGEVAAQILTAAGVPPAVVAIGSVGGQLRNPLDLVDVPAVETAREVLRHHGWALIERDGLLVAVPRAPATGTPRVVLEVADVVAGGALVVEATSDVPARVCVRGGRSEIPGDADGEVTVESVTEVRQVVGLLQAPWQQTSGGTLAATGLAAVGPERERLVSRSTRRETSRAGCLIARETIDEALHRRVAARYRQDSVGGILSYEAPVWIYEQGAVQDDTSTAYLDRTQVFREVARTLEIFVFGASSSELEAIRVRVSGWANPAHAVQSRTIPSIPWETVGFVSGQLVLADGSGVRFDVERYLAGPFVPAQLGSGTSLTSSYLESTDTEIGASGGYVRAETDELRGRRIVAGWRHRYSDGTESQLDEPLDGVIGAVVRSWSDTTAGGARREEIETDAEGRLVQRVSASEPSGIPAVPRCDRDSRLRASTIPVEACITAGGGAGTLEIASPWIETTAQAEALARVEMRIARARRLTVTIPIMPALRLHDRVDAWMPEAGVEVVGAGWVESVAHSIDPAEGATRRLTELVVRLP